MRLDKGQRHPLQLVPLTGLSGFPTLKGPMNHMALPKTRKATMSRRVDVKLALPGEVVAHLPEEALTAKAKEAFVMELLREHHISQGKAAELLDIDRHDLFSLMTKYRVPVIDLTPEELAEELKRPFPQS